MWSDHWLQNSLRQSRWTKPTWRIVNGVVPDLSVPTEPPTSTLLASVFLQDQQTGWKRPLMQAWIKISLELYPVTHHQARFVLGNMEMLFYISYRREFMFLSAVIFISERQIYTSASTWCETTQLLSFYSSAMRSPAHASHSPQH